MMRLPNQLFSRAMTATLASRMVSFARSSTGNQYLFAHSMERLPQLHRSTRNGVLQNFGAGAAARNLAGGSRPPA